MTTNTIGAGLANAAFTDPPGGYTSLFAQQATNAHTGAQHSYLETSATGTQSATWTWTSGAQTSWMAVIATFRLTAAGATPTVTSTSTASPSHLGSLTITGSNFEAAQGTGGVTIGGVAQTVTAWSDTSITVTVDRGVSKYGAAVNIVVTNNSGLSSSPYALTSILTQSGWSYVDIGTPNTTASLRITCYPDLASGDQVAYASLGGSVSVISDGTFSVTSDVRSFDFEVWSSPDGWGGSATQYVRVDLVDIRLRRIRQRSAAARWMWAGYTNEKLTQRGWFSRDIVLPITAGGGGPTAVPLSDSAAGAESASIAVTASASDSSAGADTGAIAATVSPTDSSAGADAAAVAAAAGLSDSAAGTESQSLAVAIAATDSASGTETASIAVTLALADSAAGTDSVSVDTGGTPVALADSATSTEALDLAAAVAGSDTGAGTEATTISATASASDTAAGSDTIAPAVAVAPTDTSAGTDAAAVAAAAGISDSAAGTESASAAVTLTASDAAAGSDGIVVDTGNPDKTFDLTDAAVGTDAVDVQTLGLVLGGRVIRRIPKELRDVGFGMDSISIERIVKPKARRLVDVVVLPQRDLFSDPEVLEMADDAVGASRIYIERWVREAPRLIRTPRPALRRSATR